MQILWWIKSFHDTRLLIGICSIVSCKEHNQQLHECRQLIQKYFLPCRNRVIEANIRIIYEAGIVIVSRVSSSMRALRATN